MYKLNYVHDWDIELPEEEEDPPLELPVPTGQELTEANDDYLACPYAHLEELRTREPVHRDTVLNRVVLTRHDDVKDTLYDSNRSSDPRTANPGTFAAQSNRDPLQSYRVEPSHTRLHGLVSQVFCQATFETFRPRIRKIIATILNDLEENEFEFDVIAKYTLPVSMLVTADLLGIDAARLSQFQSLAGKVIDGYFSSAPTDHDAYIQGAARQNLTAMLLDIVAARRHAPADDVVTALIRAESAADRLSDDEIVEQCLVLLAGTAAIEALLANGIKAMLQNTRQMNQIRERPELSGVAIEEMLRFDAPVLSVLRIANADMTIGGCPVAKGETLWASLAAANRDPAVYEEPDNFNIERTVAHHHTFGGGGHVCLGAHLARIEAQEAIFGLIDRFEEIETSPQGWVFARRSNLRSLENFWIRT